jgi:hypothetical protein
VSHTLKKGNAIDVDVDQSSSETSSLTGQQVGIADVFLFNVSLPIKIDPVNDQPFKLVTRPAVLSVVQSMSTVLTSENLLTIDNDTMPKDIHYQIVDSPKLGTLTVMNRDFEGSTGEGGDVHLTSRIEYRDSAGSGNSRGKYRLNKVQCNG